MDLWVMRSARPGAPHASARGIGRSSEGDDRVAEVVIELEIPDGGLIRFPAHPSGQPWADLSRSTRLRITERKSVPRQRRRAALQFSRRALRIFKNVWRGSGRYRALCGEDMKNQSTTTTITQQNKPMKTYTNAVS